MCFHWKILLNALDTVRKIPIEAYCASTGRFYYCRLRCFANAQSFLTIRCKDVFIILLSLLFLLLYLLKIYDFLAIFVLVAIDVVYLNSEIQPYRLFMLFFKWNYRRLSCNFVKLAQLLFDCGIESNPGPTQNDFQSSCACQGKPKYLKEHQKELFLMGTMIMLLLLIQKYKIFYSLQFSLSASS